MSEVAPDGQRQQDSRNGKSSTLESLVLIFLGSCLSAVSLLPALAATGLVRIPSWHFHFPALVVVLLSVAVSAIGLLIAAQAFKGASNPRFFTLQVGQRLEAFAVIGFLFGFIGGLLAAFNWLAFVADNGHLPGMRLSIFGFQILLPRPTGQTISRVAGVCAALFLDLFLVAVAGYLTWRHFKRAA